MTNLKIKLNNEAEAEEVKRLAVKAGYKLDALFGRKWSAEFCYLVLCENMSAGFGNEIMTDGDKPLSIVELRAMVNPMKEYLEPLRYGGYKYHKDPDAYLSTWLEIHKDAEFAVLNGNNEVDFYTGLALEKSHFIPESIVWQREQDEPFLTPECTLNDQYAEIEQVRQAIKDNVNHPSHYTQGKVECLDALESATIGKSGIEAVCVANVIKYLWRYEEKNGLEDVKKAQFYLNRLLATLENNNG